MSFPRPTPPRRVARPSQRVCRSTTVGLSAFGLLTLLTGCGGGGHPSAAPATTPPASRTRLLFDTANLTGNVFAPGIDTIAPDGSGLQQVVSDGAGAAPRFSADGNRIVYTTGSGVSYLAVANADGSGSARFSSPTGLALFPSFRPDGKALVFVGSSGGLYTSGVDGSQARQIIAPSSDDTLSHPVYTPDGAHIVYDVTPPVIANDTRKVHVINADGSGDRAVPATEFGFTPAVSPNGKRLAYAGFSDVNSSPGIFLLDLDGAGPAAQVIVADAASPVFSPDGARIAFLKRLPGAASINGTPTYEIHVVNVDGTGEARVGTKLAVGTSTLDWR